MFRRAHIRPGLRAARLVAAMLFVLAQSVAWPMPPDTQAGPQSAWLDGIPICHSGPDSGTEHHSGTMPDCAACVLCHAVGVAALVPDRVGAAPASWRVVQSAFRAFFAHAPPADPLRPTRFSTGPPALA